MSEMEYVMKFVVRNDIKMSKGKIAVEIGHGVSLLDNQIPDGLRKYYMNKNQMPKIVLKSDLLKLLLLMGKVIKHNIMNPVNKIYVAHVVDAGYTQLKPGTYTTLCLFGERKYVDRVTRGLKLL